MVAPSDEVMLWKSRAAGNGHGCFPRHIQVFLLLLIVVFRMIDFDPLEARLYKFIEKPVGACYTPGCATLQYLLPHVLQLLIEPGLDAACLHMRVFPCRDKD